MSDKLYTARDAERLEPYYSRHVMAMTSEWLHSKAEIAAELAARDARIAELEAENAKLRQCATEWQVDWGKEKLERDLLLTRCSEKDAVLRYFTDRNRWRVTEDRGSIGAPLYEWDYIGAFAAEDLAGNPADYIRQALSSDGSGYAAVIEAARKLHRVWSNGPVPEYFAEREAKNELFVAFDALDKGDG